MSPGEPRRRYLGRDQPGWPENLDHLDHLPGCGRLDGLWVEGDAQLRAPMVAVVGARRASVAGMEVAYQIGRELAEMAVTVVSGFAVGIDSAAHRGALDGRGPTVAVLGCGLDHGYPRTNRTLRSRVAAGGALVSEYSPEDPPDGWRFPCRNRIIAALARAVIVVEAASWSGALSTARWAADLGREVLAVPGPIQGEANTGSNRLIRDGARPYLEPADLAEVLSDRVAPPPAEWVLAPAPVAPEQLLLDRLGAGAVHPDRLAEAIGLAASDLAIRLTELELAGQVRSLPGGLIQRVRRRQ